jgi:Na+/melibiose symporter-like transporter
MYPTPKTVPLLIKIAYALGQFGWSLANSCVMLLVIYFYIPPETSEGEIFPEFINRSVVFLSFTAVGLMMFAGTVISAIADIIMGPVSDKSTFRFGRRRTYLAISFVPIVIATGMAFFPPVNGISGWNALWLGAAIIGFNIFLSVYVTPYNGLIAELGHTQNERVFISTLLAITWGMGMITANTVFFLKGIVAEKFQIEGYQAFQYIIAVFCVAALLLMALPVIFINEDKYCAKTEPVSGNPWQQMAEVFRIKNFRYYMWVELLYWFSAQFIQLGIAYYVTTLVGLEEKYTSFTLIAVALTAFVSFPLVVPLTRRYSSRNILVVGFFFMVLQFTFISTLGLYKLPLWGLAIMTIVFNMFTMAIFGIIPMAFVADMATEDALQTGKFRSATFFGVKFFIMKIGISFTSLLFPTLLLFGKSIDNNLGVRLTAISGLAGSIVALFLMMRVREPNVQPVTPEAFNNNQDISTNSP